MNNCGLVSNHPPGRPFIREITSRPAECSEKHTTAAHYQTGSASVAQTHTDAQTNANAKRQSGTEPMSDVTPEQEATFVMRKHKKQTNKQTKKNTP